MEQAEDADMFMKCISIAASGASMFSLNQQEQSEQIIINMLKSTQFFSYYFGQSEYEKPVKDLAQVIQFQEIAKGNFLIHKGQTSKNMYIVLQGTLSVFSPKTSLELHEQEQILSKIQKVNDKMTNQGILNEEQNKKYQAWKDKYYQLLKQYENEEENKMISSDVKSAKLYFKQVKSQQVNTFKKIKELSKGDVFGEVDWQDRLKDPYSIMCISDCKFACFSNEFFLQNFQLQKKLDIVKCIRDQQWNTNLDNIGSMSTYFTENIFCRGQDVFKEGDPFTSIYIVKRGNLQMTKTFLPSNVSQSEQGPQSLDNFDSFKLKFTHQAKKLIIQNINEGSLFGHEDIKEKIRSYTITCLSSDTVIYSIPFIQFLKLADNSIHSSLMSDAIRKKKWLIQKCQETQRYYEKSQKTQSQSPQSKIRIINDQSSSQNENIQQKNLIELQKTEDPTNHISNNSETKKIVLKKKKINSKQDSNVCLDIDGINFQQTKQWVIQQKDKKSNAFKRGNRSQEYINIKELASNPLIQNYCNQSNQSRRSSQTVISFHQQQQQQNGMNVISLTQIDEFQNQLINQQKSSQQLQNQSKVKQRVLKRNMSCCSSYSNCEIVPDFQIIKYNEINPADAGNDLIIFKAVQQQQQQQQQSNYDLQMQNQQQLEIERNNSYSQEKGVNNIHVQKLKQQKLYQILKGSIASKKSQISRNNSRDNSQSLVNSRSNSKRPQSSIVSNLNRNNQSISPVSRLTIKNLTFNQNDQNINTSPVGKDNNFDNNNNNNMNKSKSFSIIHSRPQTAQIKGGRNNQDSFITINPNTPQSNSSYIQNPQVIRPCSSIYKPQNESLSMTQQTQQTDQTIIHEKKQEKKGNKAELLFLSKLKDVSPTHLRNLQYSTPQHQISQSNLQNSTKLLFYRTQSKVNQNSNNNHNNMSYQNTKDSQQTQQDSFLLQNSVIKKKLLDIQIVKETEEDTNHIQSSSKENKGEIQQNGSVALNQQVTNNPRNKKSLQDLILKIGAAIHDTNSKYTGDSTNKTYQNESTQSRSINTQAMNEGRKEVVPFRASENFTQFSTAVQSSLMSQKHSFHANPINNNNSNQQNSMIQINQIINNSPVYQKAPLLQHKKSFSLQLKQQQLSSQSSFSPKKITSSQLTSDLSSIIERNQAQTAYNNQLGSPNIGKIYEQQYIECSPIHMKRRYTKENQTQQQFDMSSERFKNDTETFSINMALLQQINSQSNRRMQEEEQQTQQRDHSSRKHSAERNEESSLLSWDQTMQSKLHNQPQNINQLSENQDKLSKKQSLTINKAKSRKEDNANNLKRGQSSCNLDLQNKVQVRDFVKKNTLDPQALLLAANQEQMGRRKFGSMVDLNFEQANQSDMTEQQQFEELKKGIMKSIILEQQNQTLNQHTVIESKEQRKELNSNQRKLFNKSYIDFLTYFKSTTKFKN